METYLTDIEEARLMSVTVEIEFNASSNEKPLRSEHSRDKITPQETVLKHKRLSTVKEDICSTLETIPTNCNTVKKFQNQEDS